MSDLDFYTEDELEGSAYANILLTGLPKQGKTTALLTTAPGPTCVLNCDLPGAPMAARRHGAKDLKILDVTNGDIWKRGCLSAYNMAVAGEICTIVVDTVTLLINNVIARECQSKFEGFEIWRETQIRVLNGLNMLFAAPAHTFVVAHGSCVDQKIEVDGGLRSTIPGMMTDFVHLEKGKDGTRRFIITDGRSLDEGLEVVADTKALLEALNYKP